MVTSRIAWRGPRKERVIIELSEECMALWMRSAARQGQRGCRYATTVRVRGCGRAIQMGGCGKEQALGWCMEPPHMLTCTKKTTPQTLITDESSAHA